MQNPETEIAEQFALQTRQHFFLTGKAGTGKTTLLKNIAEKTSKNFVIVAPTGVAAINAGGATIHSMFHLPLTAFVPTSEYVDMNIATNRRLLMEHMKFSKEKLRVLQEMELLIIDEVSMVRCDIMDAIDFTLRTTRRSPEPFGGVQVMLIGDMHQLPPVIRDHEWNVLKQYYTGPYFFDSLVWQKLNALEIELKKVYRQSDQGFLDLLNNIRHQQMEEDDYKQLQERFQLNFNPTEEGYILLSTHNNKANNVNEQELKKLPGRLHFFEAKIEGDFPENMYPCDRVLQLKERAQVMFIRNDVEGGKYFNGKLATVQKIDGDNITVVFNDNKEAYTLHREIWENINYSVEGGSDTIKKNELGAFSQYPLRLAWAITIHKSQGLTFDKVVIDAGQSFSPGQVYVALSRCRTLKGIVLHSMITPKAFHSDTRINDFSDEHHSLAELKGTLAPARAEYANYLLKRLFNFTKLSERMGEWQEMLADKEFPGKEEAFQLYDTILARIRNIQSTAEKFQPQLDKLIADYEKDNRQVAALKERCTKAIEYFTEEIFKQLILPMNEHVLSLAYKSKVKRYVQQVQYLGDNFWNKINHLYESRFLDERLYTGGKRRSKEELKKIETSVTTVKREKGGTYKDTLALYKQGKKLDEIAQIRTLALSTIKTHMSRWVASGEVSVYDIIPPETVQKLEELLKNSEPAENPNATPPAIKAQIEKGADFDYEDVRMVIKHLERKKKGVV